jgi:mannose-6-phosphate isomerase-like protein (cupin superfamily)
MTSSETRPWGRWDEYLNEPGYRVKRLIIAPGKRISLQRHLSRSEHWVVVDGVGLLTLDTQQRSLGSGDTVSIPIGCLHRVENTGTANLIIVETQLGLCSESDIVRFDDDFGRA